MSDTESPRKSLSLDEITTMLNQVAALRPGEKLYTKDKRIDSIQHSYYGQSVVRSLTAGASRDETHEALTELTLESSKLVKALFGEIKNNAFTATAADAGDEEDHDRFSEVQSVLKNLNMLKGCMLRACDGINVLKQTYDDSNATTKLSTVVTNLQGAVDENDSQFARLLSSEYRRRAQPVQIEVQPAPTDPRFQPSPEPRPSPSPSPSPGASPPAVPLPISMLPLETTTDSSNLNILPPQSPMMPKKKNAARAVAFGSALKAPVQMQMSDASRLDLSKSSVFSNPRRHDEQLPE